MVCFCAVAHRIFETHDKVRKAMVEERRDTETSTAPVEKVEVEVVVTTLEAHVNADGRAADERGPPPPWLDAIFIQEALRRGGDADACVRHLQVNYASAPGDNYCSLIFRVKVGLSGDSEQHVLLVKCLPAGESWAKLVQEQRIFVKESIVLSRVLPAMEALLPEAALGRFPPFAARCLHHGEQPSPFIVLEDLGPQGFVMGDRRKGLDLPHAALALEALGRFHGASAAVWRRRPELFDGLVSPFDDAGSDHDIESFNKSIVDLANAISKWTDLPGDYDKKIYAMKDSLTEKIREVSRERPEKFNVLIHGDFWVNNMLFRSDDNAVKDVRFIDFQLSHVGNPAIDILLFLYTSLQEDVFDNDQDFLLKSYCKSLTETLEALGEEPQTLDDIRNDLLEARAFAFCVAFVWLPIIRMDQGVYDMEKATATGDWSSDLHHTAPFRHWMKKMLPLFDQQGMFDDFKYL